MKDPLTPAGNEPATFRFVAQHLNHCATTVPPFWSSITRNTMMHLPPQRSAYSEVLNSSLSNTIFYCRLKRKLVQSGSKQVGSSRKRDGYPVGERFECRLRHRNA